MRKVHDADKAHLHQFKALKPGSSWTTLVSLGSVLDMECYRSVGIGDDGVRCT